MPIKKIILIIINGAAVLLTLLFLLDRFTQLEIVDQKLRTWAFVGVMVAIPVGFLFNALLLDEVKAKWTAVMVYFLAFGGLFALNPIRILFDSVSWETKATYSKAGEKDLYFQIRNHGAMGYERRLAHTESLSFGWALTQVPSREDIRRAEWQITKGNEDELHMEYGRIFEYGQ